MEGTSRWETVLMFLITLLMRGIRKPFQNLITYDHSGHFHVPFPFGRKGNHKERKQNNKQKLPHTTPKERYCSWLSWATGNRGKVLIWKKKIIISFLNNSCESNFCSCNIWLKVFSYCKSKNCVWGVAFVTGHPCHFHSPDSLRVLVPLLLSLFPALPLAVWRSSAQILRPHSVILQLNLSIRNKQNKLFPFPKGMC